MTVRNGFLLPLAGLLLLLSACNPGLAPSVQREVTLENDRVAQAQRQVIRSTQKLSDALTQAPDLFRDSSEPAAWKTKLSAAQDKLRSAQKDGAELSKIVERNRPDPRLAALLAQEKSLREAALQDSQSVEAASAKWLDFHRDSAGFLANMTRQREAIRSFDFAPIDKVVQKAETDWPAKKTELDKRLASLQNSSKVAIADWDSNEAVRQAAADGKAGGQQIATLVRTDEELSRTVNALHADSSELRLLCGQLYDSWDKVLTDLESVRYGPNPVYRERIKTVRTHFTDVAGNKSEISNDDRWMNVSEASYRAVENDLGMTIAHKDAGLFDSEADTTPQPAGFAYIAPASQERNQYGYWTHTDHGTFWTFLPQYLIMRELLWNRNYRPVVIDDFNAYRTARRSGQIYYGQQTPASPPQYGTHGSFTQTRYAQSRYAQSGGFKSSAYASHRESGSPSFTRPSSPASSATFGAPPSSGSAGKRFGSASGQRFGQASGSRSAGRSFGRRR